MANWNCEDERVACQFYLKHKEKSQEKAGELMTLLNNKFTIGSVRAKIKNYEFLDTGKGLANYSFLSEFTYKQLLKKGSKKGLSKAARGIQLGDVANAAVRNVLTILSIHIGDISADDVLDASVYFDYKCPYTGRDLSSEIKAKANGEKAPNIVLDHIVPQNRECCGLNVKGNLVWVDKEANGRKGGKSFDEFILTDDKIVSSTTPGERQARVDKIKAYQNACGYDPKKIAKIASQMLEDHYKKIENMQVEAAAEIAKKIKP